MALLQQIVYAAKPLNGLPFGNLVRNVAKLTAGIYFDVFQRQYKTEGMVFEVPRSQTTCSMRSRFVTDTYELPERELAKRHLPSSSRVLELGGCIGVVSCSINRRLQWPSTHVVIEANPFLVPVLERNRDLNGAAFKIEHCVVSRDLIAHLAVDSNMDGSKVSGNGIPVPTRTFEQIEADYDIDFDALVMDIEGAEVKFMNENHEILKRLRFLMVEFHPLLTGEDAIEHLRGILRDAGLYKVDEMLTTEVYMRAEQECQL